ncbi:MAG: DNA recombination protein RmuC [Fusobacteria bacterium]|nr:DNA recombination protein RmuC [Fusobacteriota bacterium]
MGVELSLGFIAVILVVVCVLMIFLLKKNQVDKIIEQMRVLEESERNFLESVNLKIDKTLLEGFLTTHKTLQENSEKNIEKTNKFELKLSSDFQTLSNHVEKKLIEFRESMQLSLKRDFEHLSTLVENRLDRINAKVEERLNEGFEKTKQTFTSILERLSKIDEAQKKIDGLSTEIISLQDILTDKKSRGIFGEVQLANILKTVFGEKNSEFYRLQHKLSNHLIVDAFLFLPAPMGSIAIDSKFPLENYKKMVDSTLSNDVRENATKEFKINIKKHINDIATKYIILGETASEAFMFIPAEAIFAEIHAHHSDIIEYSHNKRVWIASPTTLMAMLTTVQVLLSNAKREEYAHIIQLELKKLAEEFMRYETRWNTLSKHMDTVYKDVKDIHITTEKIGRKFVSISEVEIEKFEITEKDI